MHACDFRFHFRVKLIRARQVLRVLGYSRFGLLFHGASSEFTSIFFQLERHNVHLEQCYFRLLVLGIVPSSEKKPLTDTRSSQLDTTAELVLGTGGRQPGLSFFSIKHGITHIYVLHCRASRNVYRCGGSYPTSNLKIFSVHILTPTQFIGQCLLLYSLCLSLLLDFSVPWIA